MSLSSSKVYGRDKEKKEISDENEWCRIRLSYYDLPYHLRRCFAYCSIFPKNTKIEKKNLIQMWMAHDLIPTTENQELEDSGNTIWNELCWRSFFQDQTETTCKMHDLMHDLAQYVMEGESHIIGAKSSSYVSELEIRHITVMVNKKMEKAPFRYPDKIGCDKSLQSIILYHTNFHSLNVLHEIFSDLKKYLSLRVLQVDPNVANIALRYVGYLKHLRYLDLSFSRIATLPDNICDLLNLQTLNLTWCSNLKSLPRNTKDLINLRHFYLEGCNELQYMPRGMGQLKRLKTLNLFVIGNEMDHCQLDELKELDIKGSLGIMNLERVNDTSIAKWGIIFAVKRLNINRLELKWTYERDTYEMKKRHEEMGEALDVPTTSLKALRIWNYKGVNVPKLVGKSAGSLTHLELFSLGNVKHIFPINNNMNTDDSSDDNGMVVFPLLERLEIRHMRNMTELDSPNCCSITKAFPNLCEIEIFYCPKLHTLPHFESLKILTIEGYCSDELLYSISNLSGLTHLNLHTSNRIVLFNEAQGRRLTFQSLRHMKIMWPFMLSCLVDEGVVMQLPSLQTLRISDCKELVSLGGKPSRGVMNLNSLTNLHIEDCPELTISVDEFGSLNIDSLQSLYIRNCPKLLFSEEADDVIALLRSLRARLGHRNFHVDILLQEEEEGIAEKV
ncbi:putative disease resistance protein RGA3 [Impatiens glandulifera]|uniref:putative disease resistance protein RGA3 n=1 Tax=Impatiens glandulifera TaxID=253017 RepID=UPI001FB0EDA6|nr:putative disease resistance protein RGA3 [Impatiens glandulifera]